MKFFATLFPLAFAILVTASPLSSRAIPGDDTILKQDVADYLLSFNDRISVSSSGNCKDPLKGICTSLAGVRQGTIVGAFALQKHCDVNLVISGGTEADHQTGTYSHATGYKLNFARGDKLDLCIRAYKKTDSVDGHDAFVNEVGNVFVALPNAWDATFKSWIKNKA